MNSFYRNCSRVRMFIAERLEVTLPVAPVACLLLTCLAVLAMFFVLACNSPTPTESPISPPPHQRMPAPAPSDTLTPTTIMTVTPMLRSSVTLEAPEDGARLVCGTDVELRWNCTYSLQEDELYQLAVKGPDSSQVQCEKDCFTLDEPSPGEYSWAVAVVRYEESGGYLPASEESDWYSFEILPPAPVVHRISPTCTVKGTSVPVTVTGEHFTRSLALTISVPLHAAFVNSGTITATIPMTLEVGEYDVIVKDSVGQGDSYVSFTVSEPTPTPVPATPRPVYPKPVLGALDFYGHDVTFHWSWTGSLGDHDYFALRVGIGYPGESKLWTKDLQGQWRFAEQGDYVWEVAICRGDPAAGDCSGDTELVVSDRAPFWFTPPPPPQDPPPLP